MQKIRVPLNDICCKILKTHFYCKYEILKILSDGKEVVWAKNCMSTVFVQNLQNMGETAQCPVYPHVPIFWVGTSDTVPYIFHFSRYPQVLPRKVAGGVVQCSDFPHFPNSRGQGECGIVPGFPTFPDFPGGRGAGTVPGFPAFPDFPGVGGLVQCPDFPHFPISRGQGGGYSALISRISRFPGGRGRV